MRKISYSKAKAITAPGFYRADDTLYLRVSKTGAKSWVQRLVIDGVRREIGLGSFRLVTLTDARMKAIENQRAARIEGRDPLAARKRAKLPTFEQAAMQTWESLKPRWRDGKHTQRWIRTLEKYAFPAIGNMPVDKIGREDVLGILTPLWTTRPEIARRLRMKMKQTFIWAMAHGFIQHNIAGEMIDGALPAMPAVKSHYRALEYQEVRAALSTIEQSRAGLTAKLAFKFLVLTASRSGEVREAVWSEVNFQDRLWTIPPTRMKAKRAHSVPLSDAALAVLEQARILDDGSGLIFPSPTKKGRSLSDMTMTKLLRDNDLSGRTTVHGFRSSFRTWASECTNADHAVMELCLAHAVGNNVERAYSRGTLLDKRRRLMMQWADYVAGAEIADVVQLRG